jgi:hypothetical protein
MAPTTLLRFRPASPFQDVESLTHLHGSLVRRRQELRTGGAALAELEQNRLAIVNCQWELSQALIARHLVPASAA